MIESDFQDILVTFIYTNLPALMNPTNTVVVVSTSSDTITASESTIVITPEILLALKTYVFNNFPDLNLAPDLQEIVKQFFAVNQSPGLN